MNKKLFFILLKKELREQLRNSKLLVVLAVFFFFGIVSPITAMFMPDIIAGISDSQNIQIEIPEPVWQDAVSQYLKNITQMGSFILIIVFMGIVSKEKESGSLIFLIVKPVSRSVFLHAKYSSVAITALAGMLIAYLSSSFYTFLFFDRFDLLAFSKINLMMFEYVLSVLVITVFFSSLFKSQILAGVLSFASYLIFNLLSQVESLGKFLPGGILTQTNNVLSESPIDYTVFVSSLAIMILCIFISSIVFKRWEP